MTRLPRIFVGSSKEGIEIANSIDANLHYRAECVVWPNLFQRSDITLQRLEKSVNNFDFAIFVLSADDILKKRGLEKSAARDNIIYEVGLFTGKLGRERVFLVKPRSKNIHLPSDLDGVDIGDFNDNRSDKDLKSALNPFCSGILETVKRIGLRCDLEISFLSSFSDDSQKRGLLTNPIKNNYSNQLSPLDQAMFKQAIAKKIKIMDLINLGKKYAIKKEIDRAIVAFKEAENKSERDENILFFLGLCYICKNDFEHAQMYSSLLYQHSHIEKHFELLDLISASQKNSVSFEFLIDLFRI